MTTEELLEAADKLGSEHGKNAGTWVTDGNTSVETYRNLLKGIEDGDPLVIDALPGDPLSGEYADGLTPTSLLGELGVLGIQEGDESAALTDDLCQAYEDAWQLAMQDEVVRACRYQLEPLSH